MHPWRCWRSHCTAGRPRMIGRHPLRVDEIGNLVWPTGKIRLPAIIFDHLNQLAKYGELQLQLYTIKSPFQSCLERIKVCKFDADEGDIHCDNKNIYTQQLPHNHALSPVL